MLAMPSSTQPFVKESGPGFITLESIGLISGETVQARLELASSETGVVFLFANGEPLPATVQAVANSERGVTLKSPQGQVLSIVEHFLAAVSLSGHSGVCCTLSPSAKELPLLDGSALPWFHAMASVWGTSPISTHYTITRPFTWQHPNFPENRIQVHVEPAEQFEMRYTLNYPHQDLNQTEARWMPQGAEDYQTLLQCATFGEVRELPALQAKGLARGVNELNTLGLLEDNIGYTRPLRHPQEPHFHKMLDALGDAFLCGLCLPEIQGCFRFEYAGHSSHLAFCQALLEAPGVLEPCKP
jgi:UDP-3-O-[3-hydroxymyristoyl] N-acetylglucosamine deacetylase